MDVIASSLIVQMRLLAERQWGVLATRQLRALGFSLGEIHALAERGQLVRLYQGVYAVGHRRLSMRGRLEAAQLVAGPAAFLSHRTAAAHRALCAHPRTIELTVPVGHTPHGRDGLRLHRTRIPGDRTQAQPVDGQLTSTIPRIIVDLASTERPGEIERLIRAAIRTGQFQLAELPRELTRYPHRPGTGLARAALERYLPGSEDRRSMLEADFQQHERDDARLPAPLYNQWLHGYEIDVVWLRQRVTLELDGCPYHVAVADFDRDRAKDRTLIRHGYRPLRVSDFEWSHDRRRVLEDLYAVLGV